MKNLFDTLTAEARRDLEAVQRELAPRRSGAMLNTTFVSGIPSGPDFVSSGVLDSERATNRKFGIE